MNRKIILSSFVALALAAVSSLQAGTGFIRPVVGYVSPDADGYDDAGYIGFAGGVFVGPTQQHEFSAEIGMTMWESDETVFGIRFEGEETYVPVLANYRYYFQPREAKVRFFVGPSIGFTEVTFDIKATGPGINRSDDSSEYLATGALNAGVEVKLNEKLSLDIGYRYLYIEDGSTTLLGVNAEFDESKAHALFAGLTFRF